MPLDRYTVPSDEDFEPDSNEEVLKNLLNIKEKQIINELEERRINKNGRNFTNLILKLLKAT